MSGWMSALRDWYEKLGARERRLVGWLGIALGTFAILIVPIATSALLSSRRNDNRELREAIFAIRDGRDAYQIRQAKRQAVAARYANKAPPVAGVLEKAARDNHLEVIESADRPEATHGKRYVERNTVVRMRKTAMLPLAKTLEAIEQMHMPLAITRLNVRRRGGEKDSYDIELGVSAFDRSEPAATDKTAPSGSGAPAGGKP